MTHIEFVEVKDVTRRYGSIVALKNVCARFLPGNIHLLEGPNGAGKSTLLGILATALKPTSGILWYEPVGEEPRQIRQFIGWVGHDSGCYRQLTARKNVELAAELAGMNRAQAWESVAARVGALELAEREFGTLSRGQKQRVALARALVHRPSVLLLDEPWTGLDRNSAEQLETVMREERARGAIVIAVNHAAGVKERLGAARVRLERGKIAEIEPAA